jgi:hypothetical protein
MWAMSHCTGMIREKEVDSITGLQKMIQKKLEEYRSICRMLSADLLKIKLQREKSTGIT